MTAAVASSLRRLLRAVGLVRVRAGEATTRELGTMGERAAAAHLRGLGFVVLGRNLKVPMGEADLLCREGETVVVVEVKTRLRREGAPELSNLVAPEASVTAKKRRKLLTIAKHLKRANRWPRVRIDVVGVEYDAAGGEPVIRHHPGVAWV
ncbi:MAG TPA: YraN family protein [Phycisphaerales bacterium]|nr:YraN family protein [Phycisphaerales bacterium]